MLPLLIGLLSTNYNTVEYPYWFLQMPIGEEEFFVVGYSPRYHYLSSSIEKAELVAKRKIATHL